MKPLRWFVQQARDQLASRAQRPLYHSARRCTYQYVSNLPEQVRRLHTTRRQQQHAISARQLEFGQPVHETRPHILKPGELTPGISAQEYHERRSKLAAVLPKDAIAILPSATLQYRSGAVFHEFHQESNFFYLTGFTEPEACAVIQKVGDGSDYTFYLFLRPKDERAEQWDGARTGLQAAMDVFNVDEAGDISDISNKLAPIIATASEVYTDHPKTKSAFSTFFNKKPRSTETLTDLLETSSIRPLKQVLNSLRICKSAAEIANMRLAGKISGRAFTETMRRSFTREKDLVNLIEYEFKRGGCDTSAYVPVVAGAQNALKIHYVRNDDVLHEDDMVLVDAGGEYGGYITDITRTWPVNGRFTTPQKDMYEMLLSAQRASVALCRANASLSLDEIHNITERSLESGLRSLGFETGNRAISTLFPHHVGHYIGLDVHDCPGYSRTGKLEEGMCVTMEPGIYVPDDERWPKPFRGMGLRIEDSVVVGAAGPVVLTTEAVKEVVDIEALRC